MNNYEEFKNIIDNYLTSNASNIKYISDLHDTSKNSDGNQTAVYLYTGKKDIEVIDMDVIAKKAYKNIKKADDKDSIVNSVDAFVINKYNKWYFIEFKDGKIDSKKNNLKNNIIKKAYSNVYMLFDIIYYMRKQGVNYSGFDYENPIDFIKTNAYYILVCDEEDNYETCNQIRNHQLIGEEYTPGFMMRLKDYIFRDAYIYTAAMLERKLVKNFQL